ncbi:MAG: serine/threonine protein kinase [bacterium]|nr:serine/threonine protein kinase [bacterium]MCM1375118.1 serine/threonine protein kinase [Muribaculum sp.]
MNNRNLIKSRIGSYQLAGRLGSGATATVYLAQNQGSNKWYALKYSARSELIQREAEVLKSLRHSGFPQYFEAGQDTSGAYLVMEYIRGITLQQMMEQYPAGMPEPMAVGIAVDVAAALAYLHSCSPAYIYRDLKAANVMLTVDGRARLVDLGAVVSQRETEAECERAGTYGYSAPEQFWEEARLTPACDVYGMGKLLAFLLTGQDPGKPPYDTVNYYGRHYGIRRELKQLLDCSLQSEPQLRYPDASFLVCRLSELAAGKRGLRDVVGRITGRKSSYRYIKCIWRSEYERIF